MWSIGCIFAEMSLGFPMFTGYCKIDQLNKILKMLGTPTSREWSDIYQLPGYQKYFAHLPYYEGNYLDKIIPDFSFVALRLLHLMLQ